MTFHQPGACLYTYNHERFPGWEKVSHFLDLITPAPKATLKEELVRRFDMEGVLDRKFFQLSLGQQNRINLIRYLVQDFSMLIMDESLANVDERLRETIIFAMKALFPDAYFLYISHNLIEVAKFCDRILVLRDSRKSPQSMMLNGLNIKAGDNLSNEAIKSVMLEMMNAC